MTRKIFRSTLIVAVFVFAATVILVMGVIYDHFSNVQKVQLAEEAELIALGVDKSGDDYLESLEADGYRVTQIAEDGTVKFDSKADPGKMKNHSNREEVREAQKTGSGESPRYSATMLEREIYVAKKLNDGTVIRVAATQLTIGGLLLGILSQLIVVTFLTLILTFFLAYRLSRRIIKPLNEMELDDRDNVPYEELKPLVNRIQTQEELIREQTVSLIQKENEFTAAIENMKEGLVLADNEGGLVTVNYSAARILGIPEYYKGMTISECCSDPQIQELLDTTSAGQHSEKVISIGDTRYSFHADPVMAGDVVTAVVIIIIDITEKEKAELIRKEFTANVTHELKTPLQTISGSAELLSKGVVKPEDVQKFSDRIYTESKRLIALVEDIISLSRLEESELRFSKERVDLYDLAKQTVDDLKPAAEQKGTDIRLNGEKICVNGVTPLIESIMYNLLDNAIKYSGEDGKVTVAAYRDGDKAVFSVADDGIGIADEEKDRVFERFYRVDKSRSKKAGGTGLGLSIVKHAAMINDADIELTSMLGKGTIIKVLFPAAEDAEAEEGASDAEKSEASEDTENGREI